MYKRRLLVIIFVFAIVFGLGGAFLVGCSDKDIFAKMSVTANKDVVELLLNIKEEDGKINESASKKTDKVTFTVSDAPKAASSEVSARSFEPRVARVVGTSYSDGKTTVEIEAVNSGRTQIEALTFAGNQRLVVDVVVNVPAKDTSLKRDVHYGVLRGGSVELKDGDFDFFPTKSRVSSDYKTTLNRVEYELESAIVASSGVELKGSVLTVPSGFAESSVVVRQKLVDTGLYGEDITVHVFAPLSASVIGGDVTTFQGERYVEMVLNAPAGSLYPVKNTATLSVALTSPYPSAPGTRWGYHVTSEDDSRLNVSDVNHNGTVHLTAYGAGNIALRILFFPIGTVGGKYVNFDYSYLRALQRTETIVVEIRNVFTANSGPAFLKDGKVVSQPLNVFNAADGYDKVWETFSIGVFENSSVSPTNLAATVIGPTNHRRNNHHVYFYVVQEDSGVESVVRDTSDYDKILGVLDLFDIRYAGIPMTAPDVGGSAGGSGNLAVNPLGVSYNNTFSISIKSEYSPLVLDGRKLVLYVASIHDKSIKHKIFLKCIQAIGEIKAPAVLYPVVGGNVVDFEIETDEQHRGSDFDIEGAEDFTVVEQPQIGSSKISLWRLQLKPSAVVGQEYSFDFVHRGGVRQSVVVRPLGKWTAVPSIELSQVSGDKIYYETLDTSTRTLTAFVRINGTYSLDFTASPRGSLSKIDMVDGDVTGLGMDFRGGGKLWFTANNEGTYTFEIEVSAPGSDISIYNSLAQRFKIQIAVVDPVVSLEVAPNGIEVLSESSLGYDPSRGLVRKESTEEFEVRVGYASGYVGLNKATTSVTPVFSGNAFDVERKLELGDCHYELRGFQSTGGLTSVQFRVSQEYKCFDITVPIEFTVGTSGMSASLFVNVVDAAFVKSIRTVGIGEVWDINLNMNPAGTAPVDTAMTVVAVTDPIEPYNNNGNGYLGYGFLNLAGTGLAEPDGVNWFREGDELVRKVGENEIIRVNIMNGTVVAKRSNLSPETKIVLVIYALDSYDTTVGGLPQTRKEIQIFIYDRSSSQNQRAIYGIEQFLDAFYEWNPASGRPSNTPLVELAKHYNSGASQYGLRAREDLGVIVNGTPRSCYYQLCEDIYLSYQEGGITKYYMLPPILKFGTDTDAEFIGTRVYSLAGGSRNVNHRIFDYRMSIGNRYGSSPNLTAEYGFFSKIGQHGTVRGVDFAEVSGYIDLSLFPNGINEVRFGVVAALNEGVVCDVKVSISESKGAFYIMGGGNSAGSNLGLYNIGLIVGRNEGKILETAYGQVRASGLLTYGMHSSRVTPVNFGGIVGLNTAAGRLEKDERLSALRENVIDANSDASLAVYHGDQQFFWGYNTGNGHGPDCYVNVGGVAGQNSGFINGYSSEAVIYNSAYGNTGGLVGLNTGDLSGNLNIITDGVKIVGGKGVIINGYSNSAIYARGAMGGVAGRNFNGLVENCYYDLYLNDKVSSALGGLWDVLRVSGIAPANWGGDPFYGGLIVGTNGSNTGGVVSGVYGTISGGLDGRIFTSSPTTVGGVVGVNDSGNVRFSYASSAFSNRFTAKVSGNLPYKGDIYIHKAKDVIVGGVVGRQDNSFASSGRSEVFGCYSALTVFFDAGESAIDSGAPKIGGIVGFLHGHSSTSNVTAGARADIKYCYSNMGVKVVRDTTSGGDHLTYNGYWAGGKGGSGNVVFANCYSVYNGNTVSGTVIGENAALAPRDPVHCGGNEATVAYSSCVYVDVSNGSFSLVTGLTRHITASAMKTWFDGTAPGPNTWKQHFVFYRTESYDPSVNNGFPVIYDTNPDNPIVMATPYAIVPKLLSPVEYAQKYGEARNNLGGFNYVVPNDDGSRAALFYTVGSYAPSGVVANRYFLDDLFDVEVSPSIAAKRIEYLVDGSPALVQTGMEVGARGEPRYYVDVKGEGAFNVIIQSTRYREEGGDFVISATAVRSFDIVRGVDQASATANVAGLVGRRSLLNKDRMNILNGEISIPKSASFAINGSMGDSGWGTRIYGGKVGTSAVSQVIADGVTKTLDMSYGIEYVPDPVNGMFTSLGSPSNTWWEGGTTFEFNALGEMAFAVVPTITVGSETYRCLALAFKIKVTIYGGAKELAFTQSVNTNESMQGQNIIGGSEIDPSTSVITRGVFVTDIAQTAGGSASDEEKLLSLTKFYYRTGDHTDRLFWEWDGIQEKSVTKSTVNKIDGQFISLYFELRVEPLGAPVDGYTTYNFSIYVSIIVDSGGDLYQKITQENLSEENWRPLDSIKQDIKGNLIAEEILTIGHDPAARMRSAYTNLDITPQDLQAVEIQHFANSVKWSDQHGNETVNLVVDESQHASSNIYADSERGGLLKIYAFPYFSNIESFVLSHNKSAYASAENGTKPWMQLAGCTDPKCKDYINCTHFDKKIYEEWSIYFTQMVYDRDRGIYIPLAITGDKLYQVSTTWLDGGLPVYGWTGVYFIQTQLFEPAMKYIGQGTNNWEYANGASVPLAPNSKFDIVADFVTNGGVQISKSFEVRTAEAPGLSFDYEGVITTKTEQAIGTTVSFTVVKVPADRVTLGTPVVDAGAQTTKVHLSSEGSGYTLKIDSDFVLAGSVPIKIRFPYTRLEDNGYITDNLFTDFVINPVLFKIRGFGIDNINGNTIRLANTNRQNVALNVKYSGSEDLAGRIATELRSLLYEINNGDNRDWLSWTAGGIRLNTTLDQYGYYVNNAAGQVNFHLGERDYSKFIIDAVGSPATSSFDVEMLFAYEDGLPVIKQNIGTSTKRVVSGFNVVTIKQSQAENPEPIYQRDVNDKFRRMERDSHYIIMEDLILHDWIPMPFVAASLDGNSKKITIAKFKEDELGQDIGLFSTVGIVGGSPLGNACVLKNLNVALPASSLGITLDNRYSERTNAVDVSVGLLAGRNGGIITNCAVVNNAQFKTVSIDDGKIAQLVNYDKTTFNVATNTGAQQFNISLGSPFLNVRIGGLVAENIFGGVISNSNVMVDIEARKVYTNDVHGAATLNLSGFVAENSGTIVSCFFRDSNIINSVGTSGENRTSGFVGFNRSGAIISGCYVMGVANPIYLNKGPGNIGTVQYGTLSSVSNVAGFAAANAGTINNCFVNIRIISSGGGGIVSGFVLTNSSSITNCFVNNPGLPLLAVNTYAGFASTNSGTIENCIFVFGEGGTSGRGFGGISGPGTGINSLNEGVEMQSLATYTARNFSIDKYEPNEEVITVWKMTDYGGFSMPQLVTANRVTESIRILEPKTTPNALNMYSYVSSYRFEGNETSIYVGSERNPVLITNGQQFNDIIYVHSGAEAQDSGVWSDIDYERNVYDKHIRLVNNLNMRGDISDAKSVMTYRAIFAGELDGNGLRINYISLNPTEISGAVDNGLRSIGLFSKLEYATVKNVTLHFDRYGVSDSSIGTTAANYVGGLAGASINSNISDVTLLSVSNLYGIQGRSIVGGLVGMAVMFDIPGEYESTSKIQNIRSGVPVRAAWGQNSVVPYQIFESADQYINFDYYEIAVAGGVIGMVTGLPRVDYWRKTVGSLVENTELDILRNDQYQTSRSNITTPKNMSSHVRNIGNIVNSYSVAGEIVGGLVGVIDSGIIVDSANLVVPAGNSAGLFGKYYIGGLVGVNMGILHDSRVSLGSTLNVQSITSGNYVFRSNPNTVNIGGTNYELYSNHHGMTVGGAAGFNAGVVTDVAVTAALNNTSVWRLGGIVGENKGTGEIGSGKISGCTYATPTGSNNVINGGFYIGGLIGVNSGTGTVIEGNIMNVMGWGDNFKETVNSNSNNIITSFVNNRWEWNSIFGVQEDDYGIGMALGAVTFPFLDRFGPFGMENGKPKAIVGREWVTGVFIGENRDSSLVAGWGGANNLDNSVAIEGNYRITGTFGYKI